MAKRKKQHKTTHSADAVDGRVYVMCLTCGWRDEVDVSSLSYVEALTAIFKARDDHEREANRP